MPEMTVNPFSAVGWTMPFVMCNTPMVSVRDKQISAASDAYQRSFCLETEKSLLTLSMLQWATHHSLMSFLAGTQDQTSSLIPLANSSGHAVIEVRDKHMSMSGIASGADDRRRRCI